MPRFWRVQPRGRQIVRHYSQTSIGDVADGLHVVDDPIQILNLDVGQTLRLVKRAYGNEIVEIESPESWESGDVEGVVIDPTRSRVVARYSWEQWLGAILGRSLKKATEDDYAEAIERQWSSTG